MKRTRHLFAATFLLLVSVSPVLAQETPPELTIKNIRVYSSYGEWCPKPAPTPTAIPAATAPSGSSTAPSAGPREEICTAGIGDSVILEVSGLKERVKAGTLSPAELVLFLNGRPLAGVNGIAASNAESDWVKFELKRTEASSDAWAALLGRPGFQTHRGADVSAGYADRQGFSRSGPTVQSVINLRLYHRGWAIFAFLALLVTLALFFFLAKRTGIVRDSNPVKVATTSRPFSLAKMQAAFWFFLVMGSFIFLYLVTGDYNTITEQALILMGIGTGTALGAAMIDANKNQGASDALDQLEPEQARLSSEVAELRQQQSDLQATIDAAGEAATDADKTTLGTITTSLSEKEVELVNLNEKIESTSSDLSQPETDGLKNDLLTDANGTNFHRFQMVAWTLILGVLFVVGVYKALSMPQFSGTLLALMGISSGTYLGFKIPEKQS